MKKTIVSVLSLALVFGAFADIPSISWFSAAPNSLDDGTWTLSSAAAEPTIENNKWVIDEDDDTSAIYNPKTFTNGKKTRVTVNVAFGAAYAYADLPEAATDAQAGLVLGYATESDVTSTNFYGLTSAGWTKLIGGVPASLDTELAVTVEIDYELATPTISYTVGTTVLKDETENTTFASHKAATSLASVGFSGSGTVASIAGNGDAKYAVGATGYLAFADAVTAAAGTSTIALYADASYTFPTTGNSALKVKPTGSYTFTPTFADSTFHPAATTAEGVTTYTYKNTASFSGGTGADAENAYVIASATDFAELAFFATANDFSTGKFFKQTAAIAADKAITAFAGTYDGQGYALSTTADGAIFAAATGAAFNNIAFSGALIGTASGTITASGCSMAQTGAVKPVTTGSVAGLTFATLGHDVYNFCDTPSAAGTYYVTLDNATAISYGENVGDQLTLNAVASASYTGTVSTEIEHAKVTKSDSTYTIEWIMVDVTVAAANEGSDLTSVTTNGAEVAKSGEVYQVIEGSTVTATYTADRTHFINSAKTADIVLANVSETKKSISAPTVVEGVANYNSTRYETVQSAVSAAAGYLDAEVEVVLSANEPVTISSNTGIILTTKTNDTAAVFSGSIAAADNAENATLLFKQGYYNFGAGYDYGAYCATGFWTTTTVVENVYLICPGEPVVAATDTMPAQNLPPGYWEERGMTGLSEEKKQAYLEAVPPVGEGETSNGQPRWVNEALGISATTPVPVEAPQTADSTVTVYLDGVIPSSGLTAQYVVGSKYSTVAPSFDLDSENTGTTLMSIQLKDELGNAVTVTNVNFGVIKRAEQKAFDMVPVAFANMDGTPVTVANVVKTANLTKGDQMHVLNSAKNGYDNFVLAVGSDNVKYWTKQQSASTRTLYGAQAENTTDPENYTLTKGQAVWLERQDTNATIITYGAADTTAYTQTLAQGMNLVANPCVDKLTIDDYSKYFTDPQDGDQIIINEKCYTYNCEDGRWTCYVTVGGTDEYITIGGKTIEKKVINVDYLNELTAGQGFWYNAKGTSTKINWPDL